MPEETPETPEPINETQTDAEAAKAAQDLRRKLEYRLADFIESAQEYGLEMLVVITLQRADGNRAVQVIQTVDDQSAVLMAAETVKSILKDKIVVSVEPPEAENKPEPEAESPDAS